VRLTLTRSSVMLLAALLTAAANRAPVGFVDLPHVLAVHPLHSVLEGYDREIAALRGTQSAFGPSEPAAQTIDAAAATARDAREAQSKVRAIASDGEGRDRAQERATLSAALAAPQGDRAMAEYRDALTRATNTSLRDYADAIAARTARALAARQQQLREKESTFALGLARRDAGQRLELRLKLQHLHLERQARAELEAQMAALLRRDATALAAMRRDDAVVLQAFRRALVREGGVDGTRMAAELRSKAAANLALRLRVLRSSASLRTLAPSVAARLAAFESSYRLGSDVANIEAALRNAGSALPQRFQRLAEIDRRSRAEVAAQIHRLQENRRTLYLALVARIESDARGLMRARGLRDLRVSGTRPRGSVDLTAAVASEESRF
jgi:hypothetical protein